MSLDGGYIGSIDHAIANLHVGRHQGRQQGIEEGLEEGYQQGHQEGYNAGWEAGVAAGNVQIHKQMEFTRQHIAEKERIKTELVQQRELIDRLEAKVAELERENTKLRKSDSDLRELIEALKGANQRLQEQVADLDAKYQEKSRQHTEQLWQYNRSLVFMNSVRRVLEDLTSEDTPQAERVRELFAEKYAQQVSKALEAGGIKAPPENESEFAKSLPQTRQFILNMLQSVGRKNELRTAEPEPEEDWVP